MPAPDDALTSVAVGPGGALTIDSVKMRCVEVPLTFALGTSAARVTAVPLLLIDLQTAQGVTGRAYLFCYTPGAARAIAELVASAVELVRGQEAAPMDVARLLSRRLALLGVAGPVRMALSALDIALWDALAVSLAQPLAVLLGAKVRPMAAYDSRGLGLMPAGDLARETDALTASGLKGIKLRLGYPELAEDLAAVRTVRSRIPGDVALMVDYNQALSPAEAILRGRALEEEGITWLEEPIRHDDYRGNADIAGAVALPLQLGENFNGPEAMVEALAQDACDYVMPDVSRIGGVTGWVQAAGIAAARAVEMSSHLMPEISVHLLAATPTAHWLEYVDWAGAVLQEPLRIEDGAAVPPRRPGLGVAWDEAKLRHLKAL